MTEAELKAIQKRRQEAIVQEDWKTPLYGSAAYILVMDDIPALLAEIERLKAERDTAVNDLKAAMPIWACKNKGDDCPTSAVNGLPDCRYCGEWEWRGVKGAVES